MENKKTRGRQRIEMKKIQNEEDLHVTFSKRRAGIYKKASELCTLCDTDIGIVIFSPTGKPFSFGHPDINSISKRFLNRTPKPSDNTSLLLEARRQVQIDELNEKLNELNSIAEAEKERGRKLDEMSKERENKGWWEKPIEELNKEEAATLTTWFQGLSINISNRLNELTMVGATSSSSTVAAENNFHGTYPSTFGASETTFPPHNNG